MQKLLSAIIKYLKRYRAQAEKLTLAVMLLGISLLSLWSLPNSIWQLLALAFTMEILALTIPTMLSRLMNISQRESAALLLGSHLLIGLVTLAAYMVMI